MEKRNIIFHSLASLLAIALVSTPLHAKERECVQYGTNTGSLGPLLIRSESPAQSLRLTPMPASATILPKARTQLRSMVTVASIFARDKKDKLYELDYHALDYWLGIERGLGNGWQLEWEYNERRNINAHLDQLTLNFHDLFGISQAGRDEVEKNRTLISFPSLGIEETKREVFSRSVGFTIKRAIWARPAYEECITLQLSTQLEVTRDISFNRDNVDVNIGIAAMKRIAGRYVHAYIGQTRFGDSAEQVEIPFKNNQTTVMLAYEHPTRANQSFLIQYLYNQGVVRGFNELSKGSNELILGYKWNFERLQVETSLVENFINFNNTPDIGFTLGLTYRFD